MYLQLIPAAAGLALLALGFQAASARLETGVAALDAKAEFERYRLFMYAANRYMSGPAAVQAGRRVSWEQIRVAPGLPPGLVKVALPPSWRLMVLEDGSWLACTEMSEKAAAAISSSVPVLAAPAAAYLVVGAQSSAAAQTMASQCAA